MVEIAEPNQASAPALSEIMRQQRLFQLSFWMQVWMQHKGTKANTGE